MIQGAPGDHKRNEGLSLGGKRTIVNLVIMLAVAVALVILIRVVLL